MKGGKAHAGLVDALPNAVGLFAFPSNRLRRERFRLSKTEAVSQNWIAAEPTTFCAATLLST
jgi:hypothetical protein